MGTAGLLIACDSATDGVLVPQTAADGSPETSAEPAVGTEDVGVGEDVPTRPQTAEPPAPTVVREEVPFPETPDAPQGLPLSNAFPIGVSSGDAIQTGVVLTTLYRGRLPLRLRVWRMEGSVHVQRMFDEVVTPNAGGYVTVEVPELFAGRGYRYAFLEESNGAFVARSGLGRFRTPRPAEDEGLVVLGASCCTRWTIALGAIKAAGSRADFEAMLLLGDTAYCDGAVTLPQYREKWTGMLGTDAYIALRENASVWGTWDDHEIANNASVENVPAAQLNAARDAFFEHMPVRRSGNDANRMYRTVRFGKAVEVFMIDGRSERRPSQLEYISRAQLDWLKEGLSSSDATFKVVATSVPITEFPFKTEMFDTWRAFPEQRNELLRHVEETGIEGVVFLAGDHHFGSIGRVALSGPGSKTLEILAGPGAQWPNSDRSKCVAPQFDFVTGENNVTALHFDPKARSIRVVFHSFLGNVITDTTYKLA